ncbi:MAG: site-specific DNA-methyltransferase, partial [candidate division Zixibacteria bacterium]|nr:site-specific DNA-methyltransferase [candidate division Zixibacteria bacterium]
MRDHTPADQTLLTSELYIADARSLHEVNDHSVHLVVTSPPYWQLKNYEDDSQIGYHDSYEDYINNLNCVWQECHRVLHDGCRLCINIGDQFARAAYYGRYKVIPIRTEITKFCETIGFDYMGAIIWQKVTTCNTTGGGTVMGSFPYPRNGIVKLDYEFVLIFKKPGTAPKVSRDIRDASRLTTEEWNTYFNGHWNFPGERQSEHIAAFPVELPRRLIRMFTFVGETVLDPFMGSGTTAVAARELERQSIGYEINQEFEEAIRRRVPDISIQRRLPLENPTTDNLLARLPYRCHDPVQLSADVKKRRAHYGSRVEKTSQKREDYRRVKNVHDVATVELDNGRRFRLAGIAANGKTQVDAVGWLKDFVSGAKVYTRPDKALPTDSDGVERGYLYLSNRTFVNARMIREGVASFDDST